MMAHQTLLLFLQLLWVSIAAGGISSSQSNNKWFKDGMNLIKENLKVKPNLDTAKNLIFFLGDGLGISTVTAARILKGQMEGKTGEEHVLSWETFPWTAMSKTYNTDVQVGDSAACATALLCGVKTRDALVGVDSTVKHKSCKSMTEESKVKSILRLADEAGMSTGFVTTTRVTHASPASLYASSPNRDWENDATLKDATDDTSTCKDIALQLVEYNLNSKSGGIKVMFGGGRRNFIPNNETDPEHVSKKGRRTDGRNLIREYLEKTTDAQYVWNKTKFDEIDVNKANKVLGLFEYSHMNYEADRVNDTAGEPSLAEMTEKAIKILSRNPKGYFLFVEGGRIDHGHHDSNAYRALTDAVAFDDAITAAKIATSREDTTMIVTADHSHVFTIAGYPKRGNPIFGKAIDKHDVMILAKDGKPYTTLGYGNGAGWVNGVRQNLTYVDTADKDYIQQSTYGTVWMSDYSETHGGEDVGVYADGPGAYLVHGTVEQQYTFHVMDHALCLSDSKQETCDKHVARGGKPKPKSSGDRLISSASSVALAIAFLLAVPN